MTHDTNRLGPDEWRSTIPPAEACSGIGEQYDDAVPEGGAIALFFVLAMVAVLLIVWFVARSMA